MVGGVYLAASVLLPDVPKQDTTITTVGLAGTIVIVGFMWFETLPLFLFRWFVLIAAFVALIYHLAKPYIFTESDGVISGSFSANVGMGLIALGLIVVAIVYFNSRRKFTRENRELIRKEEDIRIDRREHLRHETENRTQTFSGDKAQVPGYKPSVGDEELKPFQSPIKPLSIKAKVSVPRLTVRRSPDGEKYGQVEQGDQVLLVACTSNFKWAKIAAGQTAWVETSGLTYDGDLSDLLSDDISQMRGPAKVE